MAKRTLKLTNLETGEVKMVQTTGGHLIAAQHKVPNQTMYVYSSIMAYLAAHPEKMSLTGEKLMDEVVNYFMHWDFRDVTAEEEQTAVGAEEDDPLAAETSPAE